jgi:hypothetical protein
VSKKVRGTARSHRRPGTRAPSDRPASARRPDSFDTVSQLEAAEIIAEDVAEHKPAAAAAEIERAAQSSHHRQRVKAGSVLAARAATEYVYVAQDMRRIIGVAVLLFGIMFLLWLGLIVMKVIPLPFY